LPTAGLRFNFSRNQEVVILHASPIFYLAIATLSAAAVFGLWQYSRVREEQARREEAPWRDPR
jgi:hypothetical protein